MEGYHNKKSNGKVYVLRKEGRIIFVGTVNEIASHYNIEPKNIYDMLAKDGAIYGMQAREAVGGESVTLAETAKYEPKKYKDSSSARFTRL